jgi:hypothetical protein
MLPTELDEPRFIGRQLDCGEGNGGGCRGGSAEHTLQ